MKKLFKLTQEGINELVAERDTLVAERVNITDRIKSARELGDLSENAEYTAAKAEQERNENRIAELEHILKNVETIKRPKNKETVVLGSSVKLANRQGKKKEFLVVGTVEADPLEGKISDESPLGKLLLGKKVGDDVELPNGVEKAVYTITSLS